MSRSNSKGRFEKLNIPIGPVLEYYGVDASRARGGAWKTVRCFLHEDRAPTASVNYAINRYYCFSCGANEDAVGLVMLQDGLDFLAAKSKAEGLAGPGYEGIRRERRPSENLFGGSWIR